MQYYVEGFYATLQGVKKKRITGKYPVSSIEPYAKTIWANSPKEAIQIATADLVGGEWTESPRVSQVSEEQRMRRAGAPELPGFAKAAPVPGKKKSKPARR